MADSLLTIRFKPLANPGPVIERALAAGMTAATMLLEGEIKPAFPIGVTEAGRGSITSEVRRSSVGVPVGIVGSPMKHVAVLNDGRRPGQKAPPSDALELWVRRKIKIERRYTDGKQAGKVKTRNGKTLVRAPTETEAKSIAFLIARAIGKRGIKGGKYFEKAIIDNEGRLQQIFAGVGAEITINLMKGKT